MWTSDYTLATSLRMCVPGTSVCMCGKAIFVSWCYKGAVSCCVQVRRWFTEAEAWRCRYDDARRIPPSTPVRMLQSRELTLALDAAQVSSPLEGVLCSRAKGVGTAPWRSQLEPST